MKHDYVKPEFLICKIPGPENIFDKSRVWIYHTNSLSLIEFILLDNLKDFEFDKNLTKRIFDFQHKTGVSSYLGIFTQNNCEILNLKDTQVLQDAWKVFKGQLVL